MTSRAPRQPSDTMIAVLDADQHAALRVADLFGESFAADQAAIGLAETAPGRWRVTLYCHRAVDKAAVRALAAAAGIPKLRFARLPPRDWVGESLAGLAPVKVGRFVVHGAHDRARVAANRMSIEIEAALAFGTGHHASTRGCLLALDWLCKASGKRRRSVRRHPEVRAASAPRRMSARAVALRGPLRGHLRVTARKLSILDLGTGSGVLAIAAARALRAPVVATDIDAAAVRAARANARLNRVAPLVATAQANGVNAPAIRAHAPYRLVFANILLEPLQRFAAPLSRLTAPGGRIVLSGLLSSQANAARAAYRKFPLERRIDLAGWTTLVLRRGTA